MASETQRKISNMHRLKDNLNELERKIQDPSGNLSALSDNEKRWCITGIFLHTVIATPLRKCVKTKIDALYHSLILSDGIDTQMYPNQLEAYNGHFLRYDAINNNRTLYQRDKKRYNYEVKDAIDFSKLFHENNRPLYSAFDESCDISALLKIVSNLRMFPLDATTIAKRILSEVRNPWAHCNDTEWNQIKYAATIQLFDRFIRSLPISRKQENHVFIQLYKWNHSLNAFIRSVTPASDLVNNIRRELQEVEKHFQTIQKENDEHVERILEKMNNAIAVMTDFSKRLYNLEKNTVTLPEIRRFKDAIDEELTNPVPRNIREHHEKEISIWEAEGTTFYPTKATRCVTELISEHDIVVVTGSSGMGKSSIIHHVALEMKRHNDYDIIPFITSPDDIIKYRNRNRNQVFIVDDMCGKPGINQSLYELWHAISKRIKDMLDKDRIEEVPNMTTLPEVIYSRTDDTDCAVGDKKDDQLGDVTCEVNEGDSCEAGTASNEGKCGLKYDTEDCGLKILVSCRLQVYKDSRYQSLDLFTKNVCDLTSGTFCLQLDERKGMIKRYLKDDEIRVIRELLENFDCFPLLCKLSPGKSKDEIFELFSNPERNLKNDLNSIIRAKHVYHLCVLVFCIHFTRGFQLSYLNPRTTPDEFKPLINNIMIQFPSISLGSEPNRHELRESFRTLDGTYLRAVDGDKYTFIHDKIYELAAVVFGNYMPEHFVEHASTNFLTNFIFFECFKDTEIRNRIYISEDLENLYFERMLEDLKNNQTDILFHIEHVENSAYVDKLKVFLEDISTEIEPFLQKIEDKTSLVLEAVFSRCSYLLGYFIQHKYEVNKQSHSKVYLGESFCTPICLACQMGFLDAVKILLEANADVNLHEVSESPALHLACSRGSIDMVRLLIRHNADLSQKDSKGVSPLLKACGIDYSHNLLMNRNFDNSQNHQFCCRTPSFHDGCCHEEIVRILLENNENNADVNIYTEVQIKDNVVKEMYAVQQLTNFVIDGTISALNCTSHISPLYLACLAGNINIVQLLLDHNAIVDITPKDEFETHLLPLFGACLYGNEDVVKCLLHRKANVNSKSSSINLSPLHAACFHGHSVIVKLLLEQEIDVLQCDVYRRTPFFLSCQKGYAGVAEMLIERNPIVVSMKDLFNQSPYFIAHHLNHVDIVHLLNRHGFGHDEDDLNIPKRYSSTSYKPSLYENLRYALYNPVPRHYVKQLTNSSRREFPELTRRVMRRHRLL